VTLFDTEEMLNMQTEGAMETSFTPVPEGEWPAAISKEPAFRQGTSEKGNDWVAMDLTWEINDDSVREVTGMEKPTARQTLFLDFNDAGGLDLGKNSNIQLGRLREALGQNGAGPWSFGNLEGSSAVVRVEHEEYKDAVYGKVVGVAAA